MRVIIPPTRPCFQISFDFLTNAPGKNNGATFRAFGLVSAKLDLSPNFAISGHNITDRERGNLPYSQPRIDRQNKGETISFGVPCCLDDTEHPTNFRVGKNARLCHDCPRFLNKCLNSSHIYSPCRHKAKRTENDLESGQVVTVIT